MTKIKLKDKDGKEHVYEISAWSCVKICLIAILLILLAIMLPAFMWTIVN